MKNDMTVYGELKGNELKMILGGMNFKTKLKAIRNIIFKNKIEFYLTAETVSDLKNLLKRV